MVESGQITHCLIKVRPEHASCSLRAIGAELSPSPTSTLLSTRTDPLTRSNDAQAEPEARIEKGVNVRFSIDDLERNKVRPSAPHVLPSPQPSALKEGVRKTPHPHGTDEQTTTWEGVRNHEAKKLLKNEMKRGHECLFYASNCSASPLLCSCSDYPAHADSMSHRGAWRDGTRAGQQGGLPRLQRVGPKAPVRRLVRAAGHLSRV